MFRLHIINPPQGSAASFKLEGEVVRAGREPAQQLVLDSPSVSRQHAIFHQEAGAWWVEDLGGSNGTRLNGQRIEKAWLTAGDRLRFGEIELVFEAVAQGAAMLPNSAPPAPLPYQPAAPPPLPDRAFAPPPLPIQPYGPPRPYPQPASPLPRKPVWGYWMGGLLGVVALAGTFYGAWRVVGSARPGVAARPPTAPLIAATTTAAPGLPRLQLPPGAAGEAPKARLLPGPPKPLPAGAEALYTCQLGADQPERLKTPVLVEFPYDPARLPANADPESQLALAHLDPSNGTWILAAAKVDTQRHVLRTRTRHLSTWSAIYLAQRWHTHRSRRFNVVYSPGETVVLQKVKSKDGLIPAGDYAEILGRSLDLSLERYEAADFNVPEGDAEEDGRIWAFLGSATAYWGTQVVESQWSAYSGNLLFPTNYEDRRQAEHDAAHELFHKIQNLDLNIGSMDVRRWWIEASADYAAARIGLQQKGPGSSMGENIKPRYLERTLTFSIRQDAGNLPQSFHDYSTSHFIDYLVKQGADFKAMWDAVANPSWRDLGDALDPLDKYLRGKFGASHGLDSYYREFAQFYLFDAQSPMPRLANGFFADVATQKLSLPSGQRQGTLAANIEALYSAQVFAVRAEAEKGKATRKLKVSLAPGSGAGVLSYAYLLKPSGPGRAAISMKATFLDVLSLKPVVAELAPGELLTVVACNSTGSARSAALEIQDLTPDLKKPPPPPPSAPAVGSADISFGFWGIWDRAYTNQERGRVFQQRYWYDLGWTNFHGSITAEGFSVRRDVPYRAGGVVMPEYFRREEAVGRIVGEMLVELRYTLHVKEPLEEEKAEFVVRDLPMDRDGMGGRGRVFRLAGAHQVTGAVDPSFAKHIVKLEHTITFLDGGKQTPVRLVGTDYSHVERLMGDFKQTSRINIILSEARRP